MTFGCHEGFDEFDINGQAADKDAKYYYNPPVLSMTQVNSNDGWRGNFVKWYFGNYFNAKNSGCSLFTKTLPPQILPLGNELNIRDSDPYAYYGNNTDDSFLRPVNISSRTVPMSRLSYQDISDRLPGYDPSGEITMEKLPF